MKKFVIYIDFNETIDTLLEKIRASLEFKNKVYIFIPEESKIFDNKNSLEIFYEEVKKLKKEIILVSKNLKIFQEATKLKISVQNILDENLKFGENIVKIKKVQKKGNEEIFYSFNNLKEKLEQNGITIFFEDKKEKILESYKINKKISIGLIFGSFSLIFAILILIIPNSKVYIKPNSKEIKYTGNFIFGEEKTNAKNIADDSKSFIGYKNIKKFYEKGFEIQSNGKVFEGNYSKGIIEIENAFGEDLAIKGGSTLKTKNGLLFKTMYYVNIPKAKKIKNKDGKIILKNGKAKVKIIAKDFDIFNEVIGERGNVKKGTIFEIPALSAFLSKMLTFTASQDFQGGTTKWRKLVTEDDIEVGKKIIRNKILEIARQDILKELNEENLKNGTDLRIFPAKDFFNVQILDIKIPENIIGQKLNKFTITGSFLINSIIYDNKKLYKKLENGIRGAVHPKMVLSFIDAKNFNLRVFEVDEKSNQIKTTIAISGREDYDLFGKTDYGKRFLKEIKEKIKNLDKKTALEYLRNFNEVGAVKIKIWPPFLDKLPKFEDGIEILEMK
ncbi:hypothetical protein LR002_03140 [Candidatus Gracilibacteria bacterium]|nr:hypothetical protein [Candidatus Gracilibacteria bacterium]